MNVLQKIATDLAHDLPSPRLQAKQGEANARIIVLSMYCHAQPWTPPEGSSFAFRYQKPDGTSGAYDTLPDGTPAMALSGSTLRITLAPQVLTVPGAVQADVVFVQDDACLATFNFSIEVEASPTGGSEESQNYYRFSTFDGLASALTQLESKVSGMVSSVNGISGSVTLSASDVGALPGTGGAVTGDLQIQGNLSLGPAGIFSAGGRALADLAAPSESADAATKSYVDNAVSGVFLSETPKCMSYPTAPGLYRVQGVNIWNNASVPSSSLWGILVIFRAFYGMHLYISSGGYLIFGYSGDTFQEPEKWYRITGVQI